MPICRGLLLGSLVVLSLLPIQLLAALPETMEQAVFRLFLQRQPLGQINVMCGDSSQYMIDLVALSQILEYGLTVDLSTHTIKGRAYGVDTMFTLRADTLWIGSRAGQVVEDLFWDENGVPYVSDSLLYMLHALRVEMNMGGLSMNLLPSATIPRVVREQRERRLKRILLEKQARMLGKVDTLKLKGFKINALGYSASSYSALANPMNWTLRGNLSGELLGGSFGMNYNYSTQYTRPWSENTTFGWTKSMPQSAIVKNIRIYHDYSDLLSTTHGYITGVSFTNQRGNSYLNQTYTFQGKTIANADVEIYSNGQLLSMVRSDTLGHYQIDIPMYGGDNKVSAVSYDSYGVAVSNEQVIYVPPNLQPHRRFGYRMAAGYTDDGALYFAPMVAYGLTSFMTVSAANETLIRSHGTTSMAILSAKLSLLRNIRLDLNYIPTVRWGAMISGNIKHAIGGNLLYERYSPHQSIINFAPIERLQVNFNGNIPVRWIHGNYYASVQYYKYAFGSSFSTFFGLYLWWRKMVVSLSINTDSQQIKIQNPIYTVRLGYNISNRWYNEFATDYRQLLSQITLRNRLNYQFKGQIAAFMESEYAINTGRFSLSVGMTWRLPWFQVKAGGYSTRNYGSGYMGLSGSMQFHDTHNFVGVDRYIAGASLLVVPFVDINGNGKMDKGEPIMSNTNVIVRTSAEQRRSSRGVLFTNITPNYGFKIVIPQQSFEDISWQLPTTEMSLMLSPQQSRAIYIPIKVISELAGQIYCRENGQRTGVESVVIQIIKCDTQVRTELKTDQWGYFSTMVTCGEYRVEIDSQLLTQLGFRCDSTSVRTIQIEASADGQQISDIDMEIFRQD